MKKNVLCSFAGSNGNIVYMKGKKKHREGGPAVICPNEKEEYWLNGICLGERITVTILHNGKKKERW
jgi:hypothetical protein